MRIRTRCIQIFTTDAIGSTSDSLYSNPKYDELFTAQNAATSDAERHELMAQMQNIFYDDAPYHMLYYEDTLVAHRTDRFGGWQNQPANAFPLFGYGPFGYPLLTVAAAEVPSPSASAAPPAGVSSAPVASSAPGTRRPAEAAAPFRSSWRFAAVAAVAGGAILLRRRTRAAEDED